MFGAPRLEMWSASVASAGLQALCGASFPAGRAAYVVAALLALCAFGLFGALCCCFGL